LFGKLNGAGRSLFKNYLRTISLLFRELAGKFEETRELSITISKIIFDFSKDWRANSLPIGAGNFDKKAAT